jgi:tRNA-(ms[2]io[6]A)-hydroxylase
VSLQSAPVLNLAAPTDPSWTARALAGLDELLVDHAHAEKKAAATAVGLLFRYPERAALLAPLARLAREELEHFERVLAALAQRGVALRHQPAAPYAAGLHAAVRRGEPERLLDTLLCCALIEARSCERLGLLADGVADADPALAALWRGLLASEARHHRAYLDLACAVAPESAVRARLAELAAHEARVLAAAPPWARLHT